ncbi:VPLPA-CTERM sorting domain-containing protein [Thetidibacter halocola]|nr:VPLPA-CTERM sorting domain-containing protein [Thetidibacter halocola]
MAAALVISAGATLGATQQASAVTFNFLNIPGADTVGDAYAGNFSLAVSNLGSGNVLIQIISAAAPSLGYFIRTIFVDDTNPTSFTSLPTANSNVGTNSVGTVNMTRSSGGNLPQGNNVGFSTEFNFNRVNGSANVNAIQQGETGGFVFGGNFDAIVASLTSGDLRFGIHLQGLPNDKSDSYVTSVPQVPLPAAGFLMLGALGGLGFMARRRNKQAIA